MERRSFLGGIMAALCAPVAMLKADRPRGVLMWSSMPKRGWPPRKFSPQDEDKVVEHMMKVFRKSMDEGDDVTRARMLDYVVRLQDKMKEMRHG